MLSFYSVKAKYEESMCQLSAYMLKARVNVRLEMYTELKSHLITGDILSAIRTLENEASQLDQVNQYLYKEWIFQLENKPFPEVIKEYLPEDELVLMLASREARSNVSDGFSRGLEACINACSQKRALKQAYIGKVFFPVFLLSVCLFLFVAFEIYAYDFLVSNKPFDEWPTVARETYHTINSVTGNLVLIVPVFSAIIACIFRYMLRGQGELRDAFNKYPPFSIYRAISSYSVLTALAELIRSKVPLKDSLEYVESTSSPWVASHINTILVRLRDPRAKRDVTPTGHAFNSELFPKKMRVKIGSYARRPDFTDNLDFLTENLRETVAKEAKVGALILSILILMFVGFFIVQMIMIFAFALFGDPNSF